MPPPLGRRINKNIHPCIFSEEYGDSKIQDLSGLTLVKTGNTFLVSLFLFFIY